MDKIIVGIAAGAILLILLLVSLLWYQLSIPARQNDILYIMRMSRGRMVVGILDILFFSAMAVPSIILLEDNWFATFAVFYLFALLGEYLCIMVLLWRCVIKGDSLTFYMPLLPAKEVKFNEIDHIYCTDNQSYGMSGLKKLEGYHGQKKLFSVEEDIYGFPLLYALLYERRQVNYIPVTEDLKATNTFPYVPVKENVSVTAKTGDKIRAVLIDLLFIVPCMVYTLWNHSEFELPYQIIAIFMLLLILPNTISTLLWKVTMDFHTISIRNYLGITRTYEIRQISKVLELENHIVLYAGKKKVAKIAKNSKNFSYLFERLLRTEAEIYRK